jgi:hypothetical protein
MKRTKQKARAVNWKFLLFVAVLIVALNGIGFFIMFRRPATRAKAEIVPHYFTTIDIARPLPQTLDPSQFSNRDVVAAYQSAEEIPEVLAQQPCYCHCDRSLGHRSLLACFADKHGSDCDICVKEALFAMQEHRKGKSAEQIRAEIIQGGEKSIQFQD